MSSTSFRQSNTTNPYPNELDFICYRPALRCKPQFVSADYMPDGLTGSSDTVARDELAIAPERTFSIRCSWLFPRPLCHSPRYGGVMVRAFDGTTATCVHRGFALTNDTSGHDLRDLKGILTRSRSPPVQLRSSLSQAAALSMATCCTICRTSVL